MSTYLIADGDGNKLTTGVQAQDVGRVAQRLADEHGASVFVSALDDDSDDYEVTPTTPDAH